jgi:hypothetical protein
MKLDEGMSGSEKVEDIPASSLKDVKEDKDSILEEGELPEFIPLENFESYVKENEKEKEKENVIAFPGYQYQNPSNDSLSNLDKDVVALEQDRSSSTSNTVELPEGESDGSEQK